MAKPLALGARNFASSNLAAPTMMLNWGILDSPWWRPSGAEIGVVARYQPLPSIDQEIRMAIQQWWPESEWERVWCIIGKESTWRPWVVSPTGDYGLLQLNESHRISYDWSRILEVEYNIAAGADLARTNGWRPWMTTAWKCL